MEFKKTKRGTCYYKQEVCSIHQGVMYSTSVYIIQNQLPRIQEHSRKTVNVILPKETFLDKVINYLSSLLFPLSNNKPNINNYTEQPMKGYNER